VRWVKMAKYIMIRSGLTRGGRIWHKGDVFDGNTLPDGFPTKMSDQRIRFKGGPYFAEVDSEVADFLLGSTNEEPGNVSPNTGVPNSDLYEKEGSPVVSVDEEALSSIPDNPAGDNVDMSNESSNANKEEGEEDDGARNESNDDSGTTSDDKPKSTKKSKRSAKSKSQSDRRKKAHKEAKEEK
jgi:hypothetical protein